jgi:tetratricopeptide (TPR) repeat protein
MGKTSKGGKGKKGGDSDVCWSSNHHALRKAKSQRKGITEKQEERERISALLSRDSKQKREEGKNRLVIKRTQRLLEKLRSRLESWDDVEEALLLKKEEEQRRLEEENKGKVKVRKGRLGPETWKLKGAARPAYMVYDFDTRHVDPHIKAHEDAKIKAARSRNIFALCKGKFGIENDKDVPQPQCREYLSLLMQLGNVSMYAQQMKTARKSFLQCMELESEYPITPARCQLMRLYMDANRPDSARRLWEKLPRNDPSVWIQYSAVLIEFVSFKILEEEGSSKQKCEAKLVDAIKSNIFCAYYLAFFDNFTEVMDYTEDIEDADDDSPLEQAIEYCNSEQVGAWKGTEGAMDWVKNFIVGVLSNESTSKEQNVTVSDLDWREALSKTRKTNSSNDDDMDDKKSCDGDDNGDNDDDDDSDGDDDDDDESVVDIEMYATMFETAMEMLEDSGALKGKKQH